MFDGVKNVFVVTGFPISLNIFSIQDGVMRHSKWGVLFVLFMNLCTGLLKGIFTCEPFPVMYFLLFVITPSLHLWHKMPLGTCYNNEVVNSIRRYQHTHKGICTTSLFAIYNNSKRNTYSWYTGTLQISYRFNGIICAFHIFNSSSATSFWNITFLIPLSSHAWWNMFLVTLGF